MLEAVSYRDLSVAAVSREAGTSPATFYHYFEDFDAAIAELAEAMLAHGDRLAELVRTSSWTAEDAYRSAEAIVEALSSFWAEHRAVIRVVETLAEDGDRRFQRLRKHMLHDLAGAFADAMRLHLPEGRHSEELAAGGGLALVSMLVHLASYRSEIPYWGISIETTQECAAQIIASTITRLAPVDHAPRS